MTVTVWCSYNVPVRAARKGALLRRVHCKNTTCLRGLFGNQSAVQLAEESPRCGRYLAVLFDR